LRSAGYPTHVVALAPPLEGSELSVDVLGGTTLAPHTLRRLRSRIRHADVVIAHGSRTLPAVVLASVGLRRALIYQNIGDPMYWAGSRARRWRVRLQLGRMSGVAALTESSRRTLRDRFGVAEERLSVIRNWRDSDHFRPATVEERERARRQLGLEPAMRVACVIGALSIEKDVGLAIEAALRTPGLTLLVVGDGPERSRLEAVARSQMGARVRFLGGVDDVRPALHASDVLLLTSTSEGVPGVIIEAGLCGLPVVTTRVGFVGDVVVDGMTGVIAESRDVGAISAALETAIRERDEMGARARATCRARYDSEVVAGRWRELIDRVATTV
jgi:glycosyltransferase involved in cell wall biosynthesis